MALLRGGMISYDEAVALIQTKLCPLSSGDILGIIKGYWYKKLIKLSGGDALLKRV